MLCKHMCCNNKTICNQGTHRGLLRFFLIPPRLILGKEIVTHFEEIFVLLGVCVLERGGPQWRNFSLQKILFLRGKLFLWVSGSVFKSPFTGACYDFFWAHERDFNKLTNWRMYFYKMMFWYKKNIHIDEILLNFDIM
jgi:hypothetical protein